MKKNGASRSGAGKDGGRGSKASRKHTGRAEKAAKKRTGNAGKEDTAKRSSSSPPRSNGVASKPREAPATKSGLASPSKTTPGAQLTTSGVKVVSTGVSSASSRSGVKGEASQRATAGAAALGRPPSAASSRGAGRKAAGIHPWTGTLHLSKSAGYSDPPAREKVPIAPPRSHQLTWGDVIGKRTPLIDGVFKVTGSAIYTDDIKLPGMLVGKILRSHKAHSRMVHIDTSAAERMPGVYGVATGKEYPNTFGVLPITKDETALAVDKSIFIGDGLAAVAAVDESTAAAALRAIRIEWEDLPPYLRMQQSLEGVKEKIHDRAVGDSNLQKEVLQHFGDVPAAFGKAKIVVREEFSFKGVTHAFTEPHAVVAWYQPNGRLTVWSATQVPHYLHKSLAEVMEMPMERIQVIKPQVGGGFGGKSDPMPHEMAAAILSKKTGRPVKILFDRDEVFYSNHGRHPTETKMAFGVNADGSFAGLEIDALIDGGAWSSFGVVTTYYNGVLSMGPYRIPNFKYRGRRVYTNKPPSGAMRGHGAVNSRFALEVLLDMAAERLGVDPIDLRLQNAHPENTKTINDFRITSNGLVECLNAVRMRSGWDEKFRKMPFGRGIGLGCGFYISGSALPIHFSRLPQSTVHIKIDMDGGVTVHTGASEIGQGSDTIVAQVVAEVLGLPLDIVRVKAVDTDLSPVDLGSYSSRVTFMAGNAARKAAEDVRGQIVEAAARLTGYPKEVLILRDSKVFNPNRPEVSVTYMEALEEALANKGALIARGSYQTPPMGGSFKGAAAGLSPAYSVSAYAAEVEVDPETGFWRCEKVWAAHDCGKALNPLSVEGQIEGSIHMGLGQVMSETMEYSQVGALRNPNLLDYKIPTAMEMPDVEVIIVETEDPEGPFGAKEAGEGPLLPILPAVANAIYDAIGVRCLHLPVTPDKIHKQLKQQLAAKQGGKPLPPRMVTAAKGGGA